ncbi:hypothetical protein ACLOJK_022720 [Asimina triloba]
MTHLTGKIPAFHQGVKSITDGNPRLGSESPVGGSGSGSGSSSGTGNYTGTSDPNSAWIRGGTKSIPSLSAGETAGIVVGVVVLILIIVISVTCYAKRSKTNQKRSDSLNIEMGSMGA